MTDEHRDRDHLEFEAAGDEVVKANVLLNRYERENRAAAELWLRERLEARRRVLTSDELYIARSAKDAAWSAAEAAREAAENARRANVLAAIAIAIACGSVILVWMWN